MWLLWCPFTLFNGDHIAHKWKVYQFIICSCKRTSSWSTFSWHVSPQITCTQLSFMTEHEKPQLSGNNLHLNVHFHINARLLFYFLAFFTLWEKMLIQRQLYILFYNSGRSSSSSWLGINGGWVISMSSNERGGWTGRREMYATYRKLHFISWEERKVQKTAHQWPTYRCGDWLEECYRC